MFLGILNDVHVLELSNIVSGAFCAKLLADQGAGTIKQETPGTGDPTRREPPFLGGVPDPERSSLFLAHNTNKRGITLNLKSAAGRELFARLVKHADVVIESFAPGYLGGLGMGHEAMRRLNPSIVLTSITYFGQSGPYAHYHGDDLICQAMGGYLYAVTGASDRPPMGTALYQMELTAARAAAIATLAAILQQQGRSPGQHIDVSVFEAAVSTPANLIQDYAFQGASPRRGEADNSVMDGMHLKTQDGEVTLTTRGTSGQPMQAWAAFLREPRLLDPKFQTPEGRGSSWRELLALVQPKLLAWNGQDLMREAAARRLVLGLVQSPLQVIESPHLAERGHWVELEHEAVGTLKYPGPAFLIDGSNPAVGGKAAPLLGEHNVEVYCGELGLTREELCVLAACGAI